MNPVKILLVDDSKSARYALRLQLQRHGAQVEAVDSAEAALERIEQEPPDAVFMDHIMPGMNGIEALDILKSSLLTTRIPVVMCTSYENPEFIAQSRRKGAFDILSKAAAPDKLPDLIECLKRVTSGADAPARLRESQTAEGNAGDEADRLIAEQLDERMHALIEPLLERIAERLSAQLIARMEQRLSARIDGEIELSQQHTDQTRTEQEPWGDDLMPERTQPRSVRRRKDVGRTLKEQIAREGGQVAGTAQEMIIASVVRLVQAPAFLSKVLAAIEATAAHNAEQVLKRQTAEIADGSALAARESRRARYLLAAGAAGTGVLAAALYFLMQ